MIAFFLAPIYLLVVFYLAIRTIAWLSSWYAEFRTWKGRVPVFVIYGLLSMTIPVAFLLPNGTKIRWIGQMIANYWLGMLMYLVTVIVVADVVRLILHRVRHMKKGQHFPRPVFAGIGLLCAIIISIVSVYGIVHARKIYTTTYNITMDQKSSSIKGLNVVLVSDIHLGYNIGAKHLQRMVDKINAEQPDVVVIAGDFFDNDYDAVREPEKDIEILSGIQSKYGVYACFGNHDIKEKILAGFTFGWNDPEKASDPRMDEFVEKAGITLLQDAYVKIADSFYLYGRPDAEKPGRGIAERKTPEELMAEMTGDLPVIVIDHEPRELQELADAGVDLDLCGHTHDGQMYPGKILTDIYWENPCGYLQKRQMQNIVTSGVGVFGPNMRVGTNAEICSIQITFEPQQ